MNKKAKITYFYDRAEQGFHIELDGLSLFFLDNMDCPEDRILRRDYSHVYRIKNLLKIANPDIEIEEHEESNRDEFYKKKTA